MLILSRLGAGLSDATLGDRESAILGTINSTNDDVWQFADIGGVPWYMFMGSDTTHDGKSVLEFLSSF